MTPWLILLLWAIVFSGPLFGTGCRCASARQAKVSGLVPLKPLVLPERGKAGVFAILIVTPLVFLLAVRRDVGVDYYSYVEMFELFRSGYALPWIEPLYASLNQLAAPLGSSGVVLVFAVSATLAALPLFYRIVRSSPLPRLGVLMLFGLSFPFLMTNAIRSAIAIGIVMLVLPAIWRRQLTIWTLGLLLASGFHYTALLVWPTYWVLHLAWPRILVLVGITGALVLSTYRQFAVAFLNWVPQILPSKYTHYPSMVLERLEIYEFGFGYMIYFVLVGLIFAGWNQAHNEGGKILVFRNSSILGLILMIGLYQFWSVNRIGLYFLPALAVFLPWVISRCVVSREKLLWAVGMSALFIMMFVRGLWVGAHQAVPYQWIF